jgi:predicted O-methyltransferase YrrM
MRGNRRPENRLDSATIATQSSRDFVASMTGREPPADELLSDVDSLFLTLKTRVEKFYGYDGTGRPPSSIQYGDAQILHSICRVVRPTLIVETGVSDGISSAVILSALDKNNHGRLISIDFPIVGIPRLYGKSAGWVVPEHLRSRWTLLTGQSRKLLPSLLSTSDPLDMFFHDSEHSYECMKMEFEWSMRHIVPGGVILSDDAWVSNALPDAAATVLDSRGSVVFSAEGLGGVRAPLEVHTAPRGDRSQS